MFFTVLVICVAYGIFVMIFTAILTFDIVVITTVIADSSFISVFIINRGYIVSVILFFTVFAQAVIFF